MANYVIRNCSSVHYDVGSRVDGFISHLLSAGITVSMIDVRPFPYKVKGLSFVQGDATNLESIEDNSIESLSSLHAIEHFGLGRYGDSIDPDAWKKALKSMERVAYIYNYKVIEISPLEVDSVVLENEYCCGLYVFKKGDQP